MQDSWTRDSVGEERIGSPELTVLGDAALVKERGRSRRLKLVTRLDVDLIIEWVLGVLNPAEFH